MAAYTSTQPGSWNVAATWGGGGYPVIGDTATINHDVTVDGAETVGTSGAAGTDAVAIGAGGSLTISAGNSLTAKGCITATAASRTLTLAAGASLIFDSSGAAGTPVYELRQTADSFKLVTQGTALSWCTIDKAVGSGNWYYNLNGFGDNGCDLSYTYIKNCADGASSYSFNMNLGANGITLSYVIFDTTARVQFNGLASGNVSFSNVTWKNTVGSYCIRPYIVTAATGNRIFSNCVFDKQFLSDQNSHNFDVQGCQFYDLPTLYGGQLFAWSNNFVNNALVSLIDTNARGTYLNSYMLANRANPHYLAISNPDAAGSFISDGNVYENLTSDSSGDCVLANASAFTVATAIRAVRDIVLPNPAGESSGAPITAARNDTNLTISMEHCTYHIGGASAESRGAVVFENGAGDAVGRANLCEYLRSNIAWDTVAGRGWKARSTTDRVNSSTSTGGNTSTTLNDTSAPWPAGLLADGNFRVYIGAGTGAGQVRTISANTASQLTISSAWTTIPDATSVYYVYLVDLFTQVPDYNGGWNHAEGTCRDGNFATLGVGNDANGYDKYNITSGVFYGVHDVSGNPNFVDSSRDIASWDLSLGGPGTAANAMTELKKANDETGYNSAYNIADLVTYIKAGFVPQSSAYIGTAHDGGTIGAVAAQAGGFPFLQNYWW